jgi:hypothetical protein
MWCTGHWWLVLVALMLKGRHTLGLGWISWQRSTMRSVSGGGALISPSSESKFIFGCVLIE